MNKIKNYLCLPLILGIVFPCSCRMGSSTWGSMVWGQSSQNVPMMDGIETLLLFALLSGVALAVLKKSRFVKVLPVVFILAFIPLYVDADSIQLNTFNNGDVADADDVNENFQNLKNVLDNIVANGGIEGPQGPPRTTRTTRTTRTKR